MKKMIYSRERFVKDEEEGKRIDKLLATLLPARSRSSWKRLIEEGHVTVNGKDKKPSYRVSSGEKIRLEVPSNFDSEELVPQKIPLNVVYEDSTIIGVNKPSSLVVHPAPGHENGTLANGLINKYPDLPELPDSTRPGMVHRLDKDTSGILVVARTKRAFRSLKKQFKKREVGKKYIALVEGSFSEKEGLIEAPIERSSKDKTKREVKLGGKDARTEFSVLKQLENSTLLQIRPITGRTHQIRVHMKYIDHKIVGDTYYGGPSHERLMLHSYSLKIIHPEEKCPFELKAPIPPEFQDLRSKTPSQQAEPE